MRVLLLNIDSKLPNIALHKIAMWHEFQGDEILADPIHFFGADKVYGSCILTKRRERNGSKADIPFISDFNMRDDIVWGGTGYDLSIKLSPEIDDMKPKINYGFTTRGCIRNCPFCFVPKSEGDIRVVGDIYDIWDGKSKLVTLFDNNILAVPEHFIKICQQVKENGLTVDFNQGLDIRLITEELAECLSIIKTKDIRFAFDYPQLEAIVREKIKLLRDINGLGRKAFFFYVLVGFDTTFEEDLHRVTILKELGCRPYVMRHEKTPKEKRYIELAEWANQMWTLAKYSFEEFCYKRNHR